MEPNEPLTPERRCILTAASAPRAGLLRLALGPDGSIAPDPAGKAPGRGAWISVDRPLLETAMAKGKLRGALARAFKRNDLKVPDDLSARIAAGLERRALDRLGLENRAGHLIWGFERVGEAVLAGRLKMLLHAGDAGADGVSKLEARRRGASPATISLTLPASRLALSQALGRDNVVHAGISDAGSAARVAEAVGKWAAWLGVSGQGDDGSDDNGTNGVQSAVAEAAGERQ